MRARSIVLAMAALLAAPFASAEVRLQNAWLRPAAAGQASAMAYVDIVSSAPLKLVGARSPLAKGAQLVIVDPPGPEAPQTVVDQIDVAPNVPRRLAYLGSHVRLLDIQSDLVPGVRVPLELEFVDASGRRVTATIQADVRGVTLRPRTQPAEAAKAN
jgi:copper(I)-binding protein